MDNLDKQLTMYVISHKKVDCFNDPYYCLMGVGKNGALVSAFNDASKEPNIAYKNPSYCELTAQYWISKHSDSNYVGLVHYRRYFFHRLRSIFKYHFYKGKELLKILEKYDVILPYRFVIYEWHFDKSKRIHNVYEHYCHNHYQKDLDITYQVVKELYPAYLPSFDKLLKSKSFCLCNMVVTSRKIYEEYSSFLFNVLDEVEKRTDISKYDSYQARLYGFLGELLVNVFFLSKQNDFKIKYLDFCLLDKKPISQHISKFAAKFKRLLFK